MKSGSALVLSLFLAAGLAGCAGQTTDPRQGGLFSYNPSAYDQRLQERQHLLAQEELSTRSAEGEKAVLEAEKTSRAREKAALERQLQEFSASMTSLEQRIQSRQAETAAQKTERQRILAEIDTLRASTAAAESLEDAAKRLELERLQKKRDELEREAASLMLL
jgi:hypothetical protein